MPRDGHSGHTELQVVAIGAELHLIAIGALG